MFVRFLTHMAKRYILLLCIWILGIIQAFAQTGCLYNGDIYTGGSISNPGTDNYGYFSGSTVLTNQCPSASQIPCRVYYWTGVNDYYPGVKSDYSSLNCPIDNGALVLLLCSMVLGYLTIRLRYSNNRCSSKITVSVTSSLTQF